MQKSESIATLATALAVAQGKIRNALKTSDNPYHRSKYADLAEVWDACRSALSENGLSVVQTTDFMPEFPLLVVVDTTLVHASGEWISGRLCVLPTKATDKTNDSQATGSAITYCRRYALAAMVGVATDDDDGNAASGKDVKVAAAAEKVAAAASKVQASKPAKAETYAPKAPPLAMDSPDDAVRELAAKNANVLRAAYLVRAKELGLTDVEAGALGKQATGKTSSKDFNERDWSICLGQLDMRDRWKMLVAARAMDLNDGVAWAEEKGFVWTQAWDVAKFTAFHDAQASVPF